MAWTGAARLASRRNQSTLSGRASKSLGSRRRSGLRHSRAACHGVPDVNGRPSRNHLPQRNDTNRKRWLANDLSLEALAARFQAIRYGCSGKHKSNPYLYDVEPYRGGDSDRSLCDTHANFRKSDFPRIPTLLVRAKAAGLVGNLIWSVDDTGWIYELQTTNETQNDWHGYPVLPGDTFARQVFVRFATWAGTHGSVADQNAAESCALLYGLQL